MPQLSAGAATSGHLFLEQVDEPAQRCPICGAEVLTSCPICSAEIPGLGWHQVGRSVAKSVAKRAKSYRPPAFCSACGAPFPWAERKEIVYHIENMLTSSELDEGDRRRLVEQLRELSKTPVDSKIERAQAAALQALRAAAPEVWKRALPAIASIATAEIKRQLGLPPT